VAQASKKETGELRAHVEKEKERVEKRMERCETSMLEEMNLRDEKRKNVVIYGMEEAVDVEGWKRMEADKKKLNDLFTILDINVSVETDMEFCRRIGERSDRARPLVVGFYTEWAKSVLLKNCKYLADSEMAHLSISNDLTEKQRKLEKELIAEAERRNVEELTADDKSKNLEWRVVGKKRPEEANKIFHAAGQGEGCNAERHSERRLRKGGQRLSTISNHPKPSPPSAKNGKLETRKCRIECTGRESGLAEETEVQRGGATEEKGHGNARAATTEGQGSKRKGCGAEPTATSSEPGDGDGRRGGGGGAAGEPDDDGPDPGNND
jgi:hypothetical protein